MARIHQNKVYNNSLWSATEDDGVISYGIRKSTLDLLSGVSQVELPIKGSVIDKGQRLLFIEALETVTELESPVCGKVLDVNTGVIDDPLLMGFGDDSVWLIKIKPVYS
ncbi:MAG: hypothetical protein JXR63_11900 [Spirochaetales bacterium]|nr:hypothetical protein [Spirochaetales bacterium]